jgi:Flp pilus assembly secretin CpaC
MLGLVLLLACAPATRSATEDSNRTITLTLGAGSTLTLERPFDTVLIGDPHVVDVRALSDRSVLLEPLNLGTTNVVFLDERSIAIANVRVVVSDART